MSVLFRLNKEEETRRWPLRADKGQLTPNWYLPSHVRPTLRTCQAK